MDYIEVKNLKKTFENGKIIAVKDISFTVKRGEIFGLLGVNGAGKSTTINMLTGLLKKDSGSIKIMGTEIEDFNEEIRNKINVSTAYYPLSDVLTIRENLKVYGMIYGVKDLNKKINKLIKDFKLEHLADRTVVQLSSGEKTRVSLCKGLINDPQVLFLDECTVGLDPDIADITRKIIMDYHKKSGCTIIFTSHYMYEVEELCDRIAFMENGKITTIATAEELKKTITTQTIEVAVKKDAKELVKLLKDKKVDAKLISSNKIAFTIEDEKDKSFKILSRIFEKKFMLSDLHIKKPTLDDIFIKFARKKK